MTVFSTIAIHVGYTTRVIRRSAKRQLVSVLAAPTRRHPAKAGTIADPTSLPAEHRTRYFAKTSCLGAMEQATRGSTVKRLTAAVEKSQSKLPLAETIKAFS